MSSPVIQQSVQVRSAMENISIEELHSRISKLGKDEIILDVRSPSEFAEGHIKGARNAPHENVDDLADELEEYKTVYVHCKMGGRAKLAAQALLDAGLENVICVSDGGMQRWIAKGWSLEK